ncbi:hypothetical protein AAG570_010712, partial [Ranatra chinensis]
IFAGFPSAPQAPPTGFVPAPPHPAAATAYPAASGPVPGGTPYAVYQQLYPGQAPPPYDQQIPAIMAAQQMYPPVGVGTAMYSQASPAAAAGYYASAFTPMQAYYPLAYTYPQPQLRPTIMIPNGYDAGARFDGIAAPVVPAPPPGVPPTPAQLAAMAGHNIALTQKKGSFLTGASDGGYTFW